MSVNFDHLMCREPTQDYTCKEFAAEAWQVITGKDDLLDRMHNIHCDSANFVKLEQPVSPCIVFFHNRAASKSDTHVGIFYQDKVLHLGPRGAQYVMREDILNYKFAEYYV